jgi:hypothetical protein
MLFHRSNRHSHNRIAPITAVNCCEGPFTTIRTGGILLPRTAMIDQFEPSPAGGLAELHRLIDQLPEQCWSAAADVLKMLCANAGTFRVGGYLEFPFTLLDIDLLIHP